MGIDEGVLADHGVKLVILFGSKARGTSGAGSDTDIGILTDRAIPDLMDPARDRIADALGFEGEVDLVFLEEADPLLMYEVAVFGVPVYQSEPGMFEEFRIRAIKLYFDTAWIRRVESDALRRRLA